jgi:hypothetical protein
MRPSVGGGWWILKSSTNFTEYANYTFGLSTDTPVQGDFDDDGLADLAVYRPSNGTWYIKGSITGYSTYVSYAWGVSDDIPVTTSSAMMR